MKIETERLISNRNGRASKATVAASFELAQNLFHGTGGEDQDQGRAIVMFEKLAKDGVLESQKRLAKIYVQGELGNPDYEEAFVWLLMAAEQGDAQSQLSVGLLNSISRSNHQEAF